MKNGWESRVWQASGMKVPALSPFDETVETYMRERGIPRSALAVTQNRRLVLARAYTLAPAGTWPTEPTALFRIASLSKPLTAVGVLRLVEAGRVALDEPFAEILDMRGAVDPRVHRVTVRHLLQHRGGWDRDVSFDPMFRDMAIRDALHRPLPTTPQMVIDYMKTQMLDFDPGTRYAYSNFGYCLLGRIIEAVTGQPYETYMQKEVFARIGMRDLHIGDSLLAKRRANEVEYHDPRNEVVPSVMGADGPDRVPRQYGGWNLRTMDAHGGWIASAVALARFACAFDDPARCPVLSKATISMMWARSGEQEHDDDQETHYGLGWRVRPLGRGRRNAWHGGSLNGTWALMVRRHDGLNWVALFNQRSDATGMPPSDAIDGMLHDAADRITHWPEHDLFSEFDT